MNDQPLSLRPPAATPVQKRLTYPSPMRAICAFSRQVEKQRWVLLGRKPGVDHQKVARQDMARRGTHHGKKLWRHDPARTIRELLQQSERAGWCGLGDERLATIVQPVAHEPLRIVESVEQHQLMVAGQQDNLVDRGSVGGGRGKLHCGNALRATINEIAKEYQAAPLCLTGDFSDSVERCRQGPSLAMHVADDKKLTAIIEALPPVPVPEVRVR